MPVRLVIRNFPPHVDAEGASAFVAQATARGAPVRCETLYYRRGKPKTKRGVRLGSLYVEGDNDEAIAEQLARAGPPPPPPPPPSDDTQPPPPPSKRPPVPLVVERAAFDRVFRAPTRPDRRAGTWLESPEYAAFKAYDPRQARPKTKRDTPVALLDYLNAHGSVFRKAGITAKKPKKVRRRRRPSSPLRLIRADSAIDAPRRRPTTTFPCPHRRKKRRRRPTARRRSRRRSGTGRNERSGRSGP